MKLTQLFLCAAAITLPLTVQAAKKNNDRWFDIEVILFNQLGDKSLLKEQFSEVSALPKYKRVVDILGPYLNPDIASLKQLLPSCEVANSQYNVVNYEANLPVLFKEKSLSEIAEIAEITSVDSLLAEETTTQTPNNSFNDGTTEFSSFEDDETTAIIDNIALSAEEELKAAEALALIVEAAELEFQSLKFDYTSQINTSDFCQISQEQFVEYQQLNADFTYNGYQVDKMPLRISATEQPYDNQTHLLNDNSLKLQDIIRDLRNSKNFQPLLHMGWRQVARAKNKAVAVKVYAGDNFDAHYQQQLKAFELKKEQQSFTHDSLSSELLTRTAEEQTQYEIAQKELAQKHLIESIANQIDTVPADTESLLFEVDNNLLTIENKNLVTDENSLAPLPPIQKWFLDGFFNVHLKHYLFITADFNILDKNLVQLSTARLAQSATDSSENSQAVSAKPIRFKQNRRVISGEVHYFDHPYMGMIVQIRPYKKPTQEDE